MRAATHRKRLRIAFHTRGWEAAGRGIDLYILRILERWIGSSDVELLVVAPRTGEIPPVPSSIEVQRVSVVRETLATKSGFLSAAQACDAVFLPNMAVYPRGGRVPVIVTAHDVTPLLHPEFFTLGDRVWHRLVNLRALMRAADRVLANSEQTRGELIELGVRPDRISVIYHGIGDQYQPVSEASISATLAKHDIPERPYFLYLGAVESRKNVTGLVDGFLAAQDQGLNATLVVAGPVREPNQLANASADIKVLGWVDPEDKPSLYSGATAVVSVAKHEGFGMLPLEAASCGTRSILSRLPVYQETIADQATYLDNDDPQTIAAALIDQRHSPVTIDVAQTETLRRKFSWDKCAADSLAQILQTIHAH